MIRSVFYAEVISDLANYRPVYAPKDLLEVLLSLKGPAKTTEPTEYVGLSWVIIPII